MKIQGKCLSCLYNKFQQGGEYQSLRKRLKTLNPAFEDFEVEELILYPSVEERPRRVEVSYISGCGSEKMPVDKI
jgi:hypothetical protein